jgi:hypothetical protein
LRGINIQRNHNGICSTISGGLCEAQIPHLGGGTARLCKGTFWRACPAMTDEDADIFLNGIIPDLTIQTGHHSPDDHSLAGCDHLADTKTLNASKQHYNKKSTDFGFAVNKDKLKSNPITGRKLANSMPNITSLVMRRRSSPF